MWDIDLVDYKPEQSAQLCCIVIAGLPAIELNELQIVFH